MNYSENSFMFENPNGFYKDTIKRILRENYSDVDDYLKSIIPSRELLFTKEQVDTILKDLALSVGFTLKGLPNGINPYVSSQDPSVYYNIISDRITYGVIFAVSKKILSTLLHLVDSHYIFSYINGFIVLPNIQEIVKTIMSLEEKDNMTKNIEDENNICSIVRSFIKALIINLNYQTAAELIEEHSEDLKNRRELIELELKRSKYCVPDFIYDLLFPKKDNDPSYLSQVSEAVTKFHQEMNLAQTDKKIKSILKTNCVILEATESQISETIKEIRNIRGGYDDNNIYIDGVNADELNVIRKILNNVPIVKDPSLFVGKEYLINNFQYIKKFFNVNTDQLSIENDYLVIKRDGQTIRSFEFNNPKMIQDNESVFNIFGSMSTKIRDIFFKDPSKSVLTQAVIVNNPNSLIYSSNASNKIEPVLMMDKINYRTKVIGILKNKYAKDSKVRNTCDEIENDPLIKTTFINEFFKSSNFRVSDEKKALFMSLELDRLCKLAFQERMSEVGEKEEAKK